jgi:hypothetical protein
MVPIRAEGTISCYPTQSPAMDSPTSATSRQVAAPFSVGTVSSTSIAGPSGEFYRKNFTEATLNQFHFNTHVLDPNGQEFDGGLTDIPPGESWPARIKSYWTDPYCDCDFTIRFNASGYPGSTNVTVTRDFTNPNQWTIEASASDIAQLVSPPQSTKGRPTGLTDEGFYHLPFKITFTLP